MKVNVEPGVCLGFGGTNARKANCIDGDVTGFTSVETPTRPREFFGWMARQVLEASEVGKWMVAGYPGPVSEDGKLVGPLANVSGMDSKRYDLREELVAADPAVGNLLDQGFVLLGVNDGTLAAQAAAARLGDHKYNKSGALILGTGIGAGVVVKDHGYENVHRPDNSNPYEIGHLVLGSNPLDTFERTYSGTALERTYGADPRDIAANHPAWRDVGVAAGRLATTMGLIGGVELVALTGGVGAGGSDKIRPHLDAFMDEFRTFGNGPQQLFAPEIAYVPPAQCQEFEMFGAEGVMADYLATS